MTESSISNTWFLIPIAFYTCILCVDAAIRVITTLPVFISYNVCAILKRCFISTAFYIVQGISFTPITAVSSLCSDAFCWWISQHLANDFCIIHVKEIIAHSTPGLATDFDQNVSIVSVLKLQFVLAWAAPSHLPHPLFAREATLSVCTRFICWARPGWFLAFICKRHLIIFQLQIARNICVPFSLTYVHFAPVPNKTLNICTVTFPSIWRYR